MAPKLRQSLGSYVEGIELSNGAGQRDGKLHGPVAARIFRVSRSRFVAALCFIGCMYLLFLHHYLPTDQPTHVVVIIEQHRSPERRRTRYESTDTGIVSLSPRNNKSTANNSPGTDDLGRISGRTFPSKKKKSTPPSFTDPSSPSFTPVKPAGTDLGESRWSVFRPVRVSWEKKKRTPVKPATIITRKTTVIDGNRNNRWSDLRSSNLQSKKKKTTPVKPARSSRGRTAPSLRSSPVWREHRSGDKYLRALTFNRPSCHDNSTGLLVIRGKYGVPLDISDLTCREALDGGISCAKLRPHCDMLCGVCLRQNGPMYKQYRKPRCSKETDYLALTAHRMSTWNKNKDIVGVDSKVGRHMHSLWHTAVNNKLLGYYFARQLNIMTPEVKACYPKGTKYMPEVWPDEWGKSFVIKPLDAHSMHGVMIVQNFMDLYRNPSRGVHDYDLHESWEGDNNMRREATQRLIVVEELVKGSCDKSLLRIKDCTENQETAPTEYKFFMFEDVIGAVAIVYGMATDFACQAWVDGEYNFLHRECSYFHPDAELPLELCREGFPPEPENWGDIRGAAMLLGKAVGVHYRVDILGAKRGPVFIEMTPWHAAGRWHCAVRRLDNGVLDQCVLGRLWQAGGKHGGREVPAPAFMKNWEALVQDANAMCALVGGLGWLTSQTQLKEHRTCYDFRGWADIGGSKCFEYLISCPAGTRAVAKGVDVAQYANRGGIDARMACCRCGGGSVPYTPPSPPPANDWNALARLHALKMPSFP